jgi:hypothetical protein
MPHAPATDISPDTSNLFFGAGIVKWKGVDDPDYRDVGEVLTFEFTLGVTMRDHISKRTGTRFRDYNAVQQTTGMIRMGLQEFTSDNMVFALLGDLDKTGTPKSIAIGGNTTITGALRFIGTNDIGPRHQLDFPDVLITPAAALNMLADDWGVIELSADVRGAPDGTYGLNYPNIDTEIVTPPVVT